MEKVTKKITNWLVENGTIDDSDADLYEYAIYSMIITISPLLLVLFIGIGMGTVLEGAIMILPFMCIRKFSGGYHAKNSGICLISSCIILVFCMWLATCLEYGSWVTVITTVCMLSLCVNSPIDSENKRLEQSEKVHYQKKTIGLSSVFYVIHCIGVCTGFEKVATCLAIGICLTAGLQLPCLLQLHSKKRERNC